MALTESSETVQFTCPQCGWTGEFDARFAPWCLPNDHGLIGSEELKKLAAEKKRARRRREAGRRRGEALEERLAKTSHLKPGGLARSSAMAFGLAIHAATLAVLVASVLLVLSGTWLLWVLAILGFGLVWLLRPRLGRRPKDGWQQRKDLPQLFAVLDRVAAATGARTPHYVRLDARYNASTYKLGLRQEPVLALGAPLWQALDAEERIALLGHELGHQVNGDTTQGVLVATAQRNLGEWRVLFDPRSGPRTDAMDRGPAGLGQALLPVILLPLYLLTILLQQLYAWIQVHVSLRAEFLADEMAARAGSTEGAVRLIRKLDARITVESYVTRTKFGRASSGARKDFTDEEALAFWSGLRSYVAAVPDYEFTRLERVSEFHGTQIDASHPAHYLRSRLLKARPPHEAAVTVSAEEWEAVDRELTPYLMEVGRRLVR